MAHSRHRWGFHQLNPKAAKRLVADARLPPGALVLDIGAGTGAITEPLLATGARVVAFELHPGRADQLEARFGERVTVVRADVADLRLPRRPFHVVANPPYGVATTVVRRLLHSGSRLTAAHLVLPDWAAQRWTGSNAPGIGRWSRTFDVSAGRSVRRHEFDPPPRTHSRVLVIRRR